MTRHGSGAANPQMRKRSSSGKSGKRWNSSRGLLRLGDANIVEGGSDRTKRREGGRCSGVDFGSDLVQRREGGGSTEIESSSDQRT